MVDVIKALQEHSEAGRQIVDLLYGDAAIEVSKALTEKQKKTQQRIATVSNVVGIGAGAAAVPGAVREVSQARRGMREARGVKQPLKAAKMPGKFKKLATNPKVAMGLAGAGLGLQVGNLAGDAVTNRVLARQEKKNGKVQKSLLVPMATKSTVEKSSDLDIVWTGEISKMDSEKRQVFGWASVTSVNGQPYADLQGDIMELDVIEKAAYDYVGKSRKGGNMHQKTDTGPVHVSDMIESFVVTPEKRAAMGLPDSVPEGWWVGFAVNDDATWAEAKEGKLAGFSIHGKGTRSKVDA